MKLNTQLLTIFLFASLPSNAAETAPTPITEIGKMKYDYTYKVGENKIPIDIDLLGPKGQLTIGFIMALDTHHGLGWQKNPNLGLYVKGDGSKTDEKIKAAIKKEIKHLIDHEILDNETIKNIYLDAKRRWKEKHDIQDQKPKIP